MEEPVTKLATLRAALAEGVASGLSTQFDVEAFIAKKCGNKRSGTASS